MGGHVKDACFEAVAGLGLASLQTLLPLPYLQTRWLRITLEYLFEMANELYLPAQQLKGM